MIAFVQEMVEVVPVDPQTPLESLYAQGRAIAETIVLLGFPLVVALLGVKRWGKRRTVDWLRETLTHANGDGGEAQLVTVAQNQRIAMDVQTAVVDLGVSIEAQHARLSGQVEGLGARIDEQEATLIEHITRHDETAQRVERSVERLTDRLIDRP